MAGRASPSTVETGRCWESEVPQSHLRHGGDPVEVLLGEGAVEAVDLPQPLLLLEGEALPLEDAGRIARDQAQKEEGKGEDQQQEQQRGGETPQEETEQGRAVSRSARPTTPSD